MSISKESDNDSLPFDRVTGRVRGSVNMLEIEKNVEWVEVSGRWSRMSIMGTSLTPEILSTENQGEKDERIIIFMIPGNPGNDGFYTDFGRRLIRNLIAREERLGHRRVQFLFYTLSHLNHVLLPAALRCSDSHKVNERFNLGDQIQHKLDFVKEYLPRGNRVYMFGHGAGAYMLLSILPYIKDDFNLRKAVCLFPTIEKMTESPHGIRLRKVVSTLRQNDWLARTLSFWVDLMPESLKRRIISMKLSSDQSPELVDSLSELLHMNVFRNIVHLCNDELDKIGTLDETLLFHKNLIYFYYGANDGWCPIEQGQQMSERLTRGHVVIDKDHVEHSFVFRDAATMAEKVLQFIV
ncbi:hypothetical protein GCK72_024919 [Caenorhabditis remanei]|uniref:Lipid droplet-associated hydrolase n=1 Tax=Caenorhabditis remanei TaxID=31234 RepID=A0A6A5G1B6_CAERE|nr:hypothetical protein GCK72_024919 [Caenorhabditis remanei]KAF1748452.1 hypothetical protein GCK72_024919 [Caenorhabditis remanei]